MRLQCEVVAVALAFHTEQPLVSRTQAALLAQTEPRFAEKLEGQRQRRAQSEIACQRSDGAAAFERDIIAGAVAPRTADKAWSVIAVLGSQIAPDAARFGAPIGQTLREQAAAGEERLHDDGFAPQNIAHYHARLARAGQTGHAIKRKRAGRHTRRLTQNIIDVQFHRGWRCR